MIHSSKRFSGPSGIEEYIGYGVGMALNVAEQDGALLFKSDHYFISIFGRHMRIPNLIAPGELVIGHHDLGGGQFRFLMRLDHKFLGHVLSQDAVFNDPKG